MRKPPPSPLKLGCAASDLEKAVKNPGLKARVDEMGYLVDDKSPEELDKLKKVECEIANAWQ